MNNRPEKDQPRGKEERMAREISRWRGSKRRNRKDEREGRSPEKVQIESLADTPLEKKETIGSWFSDCSSLSLTTFNSLLSNGIP
jgi:hypothetical protein